MSIDTTFLINSLSRTVELQKQKIDNLEKEVENRHIIKSVGTQRCRKITLIAKNFNEVNCLGLSSALERIGDFKIDYHVAVIGSFTDHQICYDDSVLYVFFVAYDIPIEKLGPLPTNYLILFPDYVVAIPSPNVVKIHIVSENPFTIDRESRNRVVDAVVNRVKSCQGE